MPASETGSGRPLDRREVLGWDTVNWARSLALWERWLPAAPAECLEIGCGPGGGVSLWLASKGHNLLCTDMNAPGAAVRERHLRHGVADRISYEAIDATRIPYEGRFDVVVLKSVFGGIWAFGGESSVLRAIEGIHRALRPGGRLLFAENLRGTAFHMFCRKVLLRRANTWHYPRAASFLRLLGDDWAELHYETSGFLGTFGRTERQREWLGRVDEAARPLVPAGWRYIISGVAVKR